MKLITKKTYYLLVVYFSIFVLVGISFYYVTNYVILKDLTNSLYHRKGLLIRHLSRSDSIIKYQKFSDNRISIEESPVPLKAFDKVSDTLIFSKDEDKYVAYRQLNFPAEVRGRYYNVYVRRLLVETEGLGGPLLLLTVVLFLILILALFFANQWVSNKVWKPFYITVNKLKRYQVSEAEAISFPETDVEEFNELNTVISHMTERIRQDFYMLKEFTENTSHELQTPLAVIKSKLELLMQADNLTDTQYNHLNAAYASVSKLAKLNEALGLLCKIENSQFAKNEKLDLCQLIESKLFNYEDLLKIKSITVKREFHAHPEIVINPVLGDILIENLVNNAIRHNIAGGEILIEVQGREVRITNTGNVLEVDPASLFERFTKSNSQSFGLGLSIVREICRQNNIDIGYVYENNRHTLILKLK